MNFAASVPNRPSSPWIFGAGDPPAAATHSVIVPRIRCANRSGGRGLRGEAQRSVRDLDAFYLSTGDGQMSGGGNS